MRARTDQSFSEFLLRIGNGEKPTIRDDLVLLPKQLVIQNTSSSPGEDTLVKEIFPSMDKNASGAKYMIERAILARRNKYVDQLNEKLIFKFPGESRTFLSFDSAEDDTNNYYQEDYLNTLTPNGLPPHRLVLKKNAPIMLLRNLDASNGLCNDTRIICRGFDKNVIHAEIMIGENAFKHVFIPRIQLSPPENEAIRCTLKRNINVNDKIFGHDRAATAKKRNIHQKHRLQIDIRFRRYTITLD
ncbi:uncharacterized protein LOC124896875 [Capsicum annuum]|uniref:uncharacterized protein LOC124896875 n=1 Tax=Capsicum annuum TaxID=4072 RepID=UPI001FB0D07C|nr:uncharacterized protein LOC124896875 [Capsicum annuum]